MLALSQVDPSCLCPWRIVYLSLLLTSCSWLHGWTLLLPGGAFRLVAHSSPRWPMSRLNFTGRRGPWPFRV